VRVGLAVPGVAVAARILPKIVFGQDAVAKSGQNNGERIAHIVDPRRRQDALARVNAPVVNALAVVGVRCANADQAMRARAFPET